MTYRPRHDWRHKLPTKKGKRRLKTCLTFLLFLECSYGAYGVLAPYIVISPIIQTEDSIQLEWVLPDSENQTGQQEIYGIQFRLNEGKIEFYRQRQEISGH